MADADTIMGLGEEVSAEEIKEPTKPGARESKANVIGPHAGDKAVWASIGELWMGVWWSGASGESQVSTGTHTEVGEHEEGAGIHGCGEWKDETSASVTELVAMF